MGGYPALPEYVLFSHVCASITFLFPAPTPDSSTTAALVVIGKLKNILVNINMDNVKLKTFFDFFNGK